MLIADRYRVVKLLGEGGMAQVWRGEDIRLGRPVAVKVLQPHLLHDSVREQALSRFEREGRAAARLAHPNVARVYDTGEHDGLPYLVLEYLHGQDLKSLLDRNPGGLPIEQVLEFAAQAAKGLAAAHDAGMVHRDIKPANLMLTADGTVKVCDFGIARLHDATGGLTGDAPIGTWYYMAPEQIMGGSVDHRTDLYALGVTIFQLLTGRPVFTGDDVRAVIAQHLEKPPPPARTLRADIPLELETFLETLLAKEPDRRPPDADTVAERLHDLRRCFASPSYPVNRLRARLDQAVEHGEAGRRDIAIAHLRSLLSDYVCDPRFRPDHPDVLTARHNLARWAGETGDAATARDQYVSLLLSRAHVLGLEHPDTLTALHELARWTDEAGDSATAREALTTLLLAYEGALGPEHPGTLAIRNSLARWASKATEGR